MKDPTFLPGLDRRLKSPPTHTCTHACTYTCRHMGTDTFTVCTRTHVSHMHTHGHPSRHACTHVYTDHTHTCAHRLHTHETHKNGPFLKGQTHREDKERLRSTTIFDRGTRDVILWDGTGSTPGPKTEVLVSKTV